MSRVRSAGVQGEDAGSRRARKGAAARPDPREPSQPRSRASLDRMLATARRLMIERQGEDFTLQEISVLGEVSIGSIYFRFHNKDDLVRAVIGQELARMAADEVLAVAETVSASGSLADYVPAYVRTFAEILRAHSLMLRLAMRRAATDSEMSDVGEQHELDASLRLAASLQHFRDQVPGDLEARAKLAFHILFATVARHLSLDSHAPAVSRIDWDMLLEEMSQVLLAYLTAPARRAGI